MPTATPTTSAAPARLTLTVTSRKTGVTAAAAVTIADIRTGTFSLTVTTTVGARAARTGHFLCAVAGGCKYLGGSRLVTTTGGRIDEVELEGEALAEVTAAAAYMWTELRAAAVASRKAALTAKVAELETEGDLDTAGRVSAWLAAA